jgi:hypothetical protein
LFAQREIAESLAFRGGTALYKLHLTPAARYSEDIDLVQSRPGAIGRVLDPIHAVLDPWLGAPKSKQTEGRVHTAIVQQPVGQLHPDATLRRMNACPSGSTVKAS